MERVFRGWALFKFSMLLGECFFEGWGCANEDRYFIEEIQYATLTNSMQKLTKTDQDLLVGFEDDGI